MRARTARLPWYAAGLGVIAAAGMTGCGSSASGSATTAAPVTPLEAVKLAANAAKTANSFTGSMSVQITPKPGAANSTGLSGNTSMSVTFAERLHPSLLASEDVESMDTDGTALPGGLTGIITPTDFYLKWPYLTQALHLTKPWVALPVSAASSSTGINLSQLINQATGNSPLTQTQMLAGATSVREVGTGTVDGVPVTEYTGTLPVSKAVSYLSSSIKPLAEQEITAEGLTTEKFTVWIDGQHLTRKASVIIDGTSVTETVNMTLTSINQPVNITVPPASETSPMPANL